MNTLETKRLLLRDWQERDLGCGVHNDDTIRYLIEVKNNYAMVLKETGEIIGTIGLNEDADNNPNRRNVGVRVIEAYRNQGYMQEALAEVFLHARLPIATQAIVLVISRDHGKKGGTRIHKSART